MIRMKDVAVRAGVSRTTVSLVLNEKYNTIGISAETRERVLCAARDMGYRRNEAARQVISGQSRALGFVVGEQDKESGVFGQILVGALEQAEAYGYTVRVLLLNGSHESWREASARAAELRLAGAMCLYLREPVLSEFRREIAHYCSAPLVLVDSSLPQTQGYRVLSDDAAGCREVIQHLLSLGHEPGRIAFISGDKNSGAALLRETSFQQILLSHGWNIEPWQVGRGNWQADDVIEIVTTLFTKMPIEKRPTALFCANDKMALIAVRTLRRLGFSVPSDVSIVGFANLELAQFTDPALTTVEQPFLEMGREAVRLLIEPPGGGDKEGADFLLPTRLIIRESTAQASLPVTPAT